MQRRFVLLALASAALFVLPQSAYAQEAQPGDACTTNGAVRSTGGPEQMPRRMLICNGTTWQSALEQTTAGASLLQIGNDTGSCTTAKLGRMRYNGTSTWEYCNGSTWAALGSGGSAAGADREIQFNSGGAFGTSSTFKLMADGDLLLAGPSTTGIASVPVSGNGTRMFFDFQTSAFRVGSVSGTQWDNANIGIFSVAMGFDATASNTFGVAMGAQTTASGVSSTAMGYNTIAAGSHSFAAGRDVNITTTGSGSFGFGLTNTAPAIKPQVSGAQSFGIFMGNQNAVNFSAANTMGLFGGKMVIDSTIPATNLVADTELEIDGTLKIGSGGEACDASREGSIQYLAASDTFQVCATAGSWTALGGGGSAAGSDREIQFNSGGLFGASASLTFDGTGLYSKAFYADATGTTYDTAVSGISDADYGVGIYGEFAHPTNLGTGVRGNASSTNGRGVQGTASASTGLTYGGYFESDSSTGVGVFGIGGGYGIRGEATSATGYAGYFFNSADGWGVYSENDMGLASGKYLNWGSTRGSTGYGIRDNAGTIECKNSGGAWAACAGSGGASLSGLTAATATNTIANANFTQTWNWDTLTTGNGLVLNSTSLTDGNILRVINSNTTGTGGPIYAQTSSTGALSYGVGGFATSTTGLSIGLYGSSTSSSGNGVRGSAGSGTGTTSGVYGSASSTSGRGVYGWAAAATGTTYGVYGTSASSAGYGGYFTNTSTGVALRAQGDLEYTGSLRDMSDIRLKDNVKPLDSSLEKITQLQGISFTMKDSNTHDTEYGFSAQDVQKIYPNLVHKANDEDGTLSMNYTGLIAPLVEAIKEQQKEIEVLKAEIEALKARE
ncbi:tail fiber domain-containing protein [Micavibrio aeruginosavorus]|uniref:Hep_Hag family protein n=1 Tax=Micavibrio aeruginosavorus (strain ARL-13) TaxID=856793 RepID=G2KMH1_MICAA|nr:tail fiber domain-containing protein [Micavibrio aeruginosavorus]AEP10664.1 hep_Hag family protein [Micavibrio aeruginosavorus ARL-13]